MATTPTPTIKVLIQRYFIILILIIIKQEQLITTLIIFITIVIATITIKITSPISFSLKEHTISFFARGT